MDFKNMPYLAKKNLKLSKQMFIQYVQKEYPVLVLCTSLYSMWECSECCFTTSVPVDVGDVAGCSFADTHSFTGQYIVDVHKWIMGGHGKVLSSICNHETLII